MGRTVTVFLEKDGARKVEVTKRIEGWREKVWLKENDTQPLQEEYQENHQPTMEEEDETTLEDVGIQQDTPDEIDAMNKTCSLRRSHCSKKITVK